MTNQKRQKTENDGYGKGTLKNSIPKKQNQENKNKSGKEESDKGQF